MTPKLNHIDEKNNPKMVDVSDKGVTHRLAIASCELKCDPLIFEQLSNGDIKTKKGPVFHTAITAGTMAVKKTSDIIPFCNILFDQITFSRRVRKKKPFLFWNTHKSKNRYSIYY